MRYDRCPNCESKEHVDDADDDKVECPDCGTVHDLSERYLTESDKKQMSSYDEQMYELERGVADE